ncbi:hypothetical protein [Colwellia sp. RSH04]|nr:hypothetical protein [Colwellia sp. RSH04]
MLYQLMTKLNKTFFIPEINTDKEVPMVSVKVEGTEQKADLLKPIIRV